VKISPDSEDLVLSDRGRVVRKGSERQEDETVYTARSVLDNLTGTYFQDRNRATQSLPVGNRRGGGCAWPSKGGYGNGPRASEKGGGQQIDAMLSAFISTTWQSSWKSTVEET